MRDCDPKERFGPDARSPLFFRKLKIGNVRTERWQMTVRTGWAMKFAFLFVTLTLTVSSVGACSATGSAPTQPVGGAHTDGAVLCADQPSAVDDSTAVPISAASLTRIAGLTGGSVYCPAWAAAKYSSDPALH